MDPGTAMAGCPLSVPPEAKRTGTVLHYCVLALYSFWTTEFPWFLSVVFRKLRTYVTLQAGDDEALSPAEVSKETKLIWHKHAVSST